VKNPGYGSVPDGWPRSQLVRVLTALVNGVPQGIQAADVAIPFALFLGAGPICDALEGTVLNPINLIP
jgi:hypothetical protein